MRIAVSNPDNIGDLVLRQPMVSALLNAGHEVLLIVRDFVTPLAMDLFPEAKVLQCAGNPYERDFGLQSHLGQAFLQRVVEFDPQIFVVASYQHTMMEEILASALPKADCVGFTGHLFQARPETIVLSVIQFATRVAVVEDSSELEKNAQLCSAILGRAVTLDPPRMEALPDGIETAKFRLEKLGFAGQRFWAVCAGDIADKSVKNWHREQWAEFCRGLISKHDIPLLFIGSTDEHESTAAIQKLMGEAGRRTAAITDAPTKLRTLTGLLHLAEGYIGKDTGPMHIAAALGKPVLAVFGGGHWPRFVPAAKIGAAFTVSVPCQGCNWTCHLERSHCVKDIPVGTVLQAAGAMLAGHGEDFRVEVLQPDGILESAILRELWASARREHLKVAAERSNFLQWHDDRMRDIAQLRTQLEVTSGERDSMAKAAAEAVPLRAAMQELEQRLAQRESERNGLTAELEARKVRQEEITANAAAEAALLRSAMQELEQRLAQRENDRNGLTAELEARKLRQEEITATAAAEAALLRSAMQELEQRLGQREGERNGLAAELEARKLRQEELQVLVERTASLEERAATLEFESRLASSNLRQATEDRMAAERKLERFRHAALRKIVESRANADSLKKELAALRAHLDLHGAAAQEREEWRAKWESAAAESEALRGRFEEAAAESETMRRRLEEAAVRVSALQLQVDTSDSRYQGQLADLDQVLKRRANELASALALIPDLRDELGTLSAELGQAEGKLAVTAQLYEAAQRELDRTQEELRVIAPDHAARLVVIEKLSAGMAELDKDREAKRALIQELEEKLAVSEADREKRLEVIHALSGQLMALERVAADRQALIEELNARLEAAETVRREFIRSTDDLSRRLADSERDREARLRLIEELSGTMVEIERDREDRLRLIVDISARLEESEADRDERRQLIEEISDRLAECERDRAQRLRLIEEVSARLEASEKDREDRLRLIESLSDKLAVIEADRENRGNQITALHGHANSLAAEIAALRNLLPYRILKQLHIV